MDNVGRYAQRGVSTGKEDVHKAVKSIGKGLFPTAFCNILPDFLSKRADSAVVMHADGAGTKSIIAYLWWKETGDASVFRGISQDAAVMNIDDMICVGATGPIILSSTIGRNKALVDGNVISAIINGFHDFAGHLAQYGVELVVGGGETADVGDLVRTIIVDATCCANIKRAEIIDNRNIKPGDLIVGLSSFGRTTYEKKYNSGIGSNGLTSARHELLHNIYAEKYPEAFAPETVPDLVYCGSFKMQDPLEGTPLTIGEALLSPTRTFSPAILKILSEGRDLIHGIIHNTGGAHTKCLNFGENLRYIKDNPFDPPPIFKQIQKSSGTTDKEMFEVFNMGCRMELYTSKEGASMIMKICDKFNLETKIIGFVERAGNKKGSCENKLIINSDNNNIISWKK